MKWKDTWLWGEQIANRPDLIRDFEDEPEEQPHSSNANNRKLVSQWTVIDDDDDSKNVTKESNHLFIR